MLFHSPTFLIFVVLFIVGLALFKGERRIIYVCVSSYVFYGWWYPPYVVILFGLSAFAHYFALSPNHSRARLAAGIAIGLLPLAFFKYWEFILDNIEALIGTDFPFRHDFALPIGISFISFTALAYIIDTRRNRDLVERNFWHTALFISFFPQLIAGPILRCRELMPQIAGIRFTPSALKLALFLFAIGAMKKVGVADQLAPIVDQIYSGEGPIDRTQALIAFYAFSVQIYCDFSGYTDMALALGFLLGVEFPLNFNSPYAATSIRDFWRRWHMTLSRWLRDYLYIPLGGNRHGATRMVFALMATMLLGGLWHGAAWNFVIWGGLHGLFVTLEHLTEKAGVRFKAIPRWARSLIVIHLVGLTWIFFRAPDFSRAWDMILGFARPGDIALLADNPLVPVLILGVFALHPLDTVPRIRAFADKVPMSIILPLSVMLILICAALSVNNPSAFIYFDF